MMKLLILSVGLIIGIVFVQTASAQSNYNFDFGTGKVASGYKQVTAVTKYSDQQDYGFDYGTKAVTINRDENDDLKSDFGTSTAPMFFSVKVPEGNYKVTVTLGDAWHSSSTTIKAEKIAIADHAASGSTLRASYSRGRLAKVCSLMKPGDYLFIEFAHNDQKEGSGEEAYTTYNKYLRIYVDSARAHGAIPVFVTSTDRRRFDKSGQIINTLGEFPNAMRYEAKKSHVVLIDLNAMTEILYEAKLV